MYAAALIRGDLKNTHTVRTGIEYMTWLAEFYTRTTEKSTFGMFQIGGGIAGDFPICVVPMLHQDLGRTARAALGLLLPDQRFNDELRQLFRRRAERKNHLGQTGRGHAQFHHRIRRHHRRAVDFCARAGVVAFMKPNDFSDARVLVTGGAGFIGSALVWALNRHGCEHIIVCDRLGTDEKWRNLTPLRFADYLEADDLLPRLQNGALGQFNLVLHLGACSSTTERDAGFLIRNNYEFTRDLAAWSLANKARFVYASSAATYGDGSAGMDDDDSKLDTSAAAEHVRLFEALV